MRVVLASSSPRRRELLEMAGYVVEVRKPDVDEARLADEAVDAMLVRLARDKCRAVGDSDCPIIAADTVVELEGEILGKPNDAEHAAQMLAKLSGRTHRVLTGFAVRSARGSEAAVSTAVVITVVRCRVLTTASIAAYVATGDPLDKAGAYGIQSSGAALVADLSGSYTNVVGLPLDEVEAILRDE